MKDRIAMIKAAVEKVQGGREEQRKINAKFIKDCEKKIARIKARQERQAEKEMAELDENYNQIDIKQAKKIAIESVGETYFETTRFDNEWN